MYSPKTSDEAVRRATGKSWKEWFGLLDKSGAKKKKHKEIAQWVFDKHLGKKNSNINVATSGGWWSQMVTVEYERSRGLRKVNQNEQGFLAAVHKTFALSRREFVRRWSALPAVKKLEPTPTRSKRPMLRYKAKQGIVVVTMDEKPGGKLRVMVEAARLPTKTVLERERAFWRGTLDSLAQ
jgi:hypothetical protein